MGNGNGAHSKKAPPRRHLTRLLVGAAVVAAASGGVGMLLTRAAAAPDGAGSGGISAPAAATASGSSTTGWAEGSSLQPVTAAAVGPAGGRLGPTTPITVTYTGRPPLSLRPTLQPPVAGSWTVSGRVATFVPAADWPPYSHVTVTVPPPSGHTLAGSSPATSASSSPATSAGARTATFTTPPISLLRAQQILARLGYLPVTFSSTAPAPATAAAETAFGYDPPPGTFTWRSASLQATLGPLWVPGQATTVTTGALMAFQADHQLSVDGIFGPQTWAALVQADLADHEPPKPYTTVVANLNAPETLTVEVDGNPVLTSPVNSGIAGARTPAGTFPIFERLPSTTMRGTMPDGVSYVDPNIRWVNYFYEGDAIHGFVRAAYGFPQSNGCLELPVATAQKVYGLLHLGDLVTVAGTFSQAG